jgi:hypothetical protein
MQLIRREVQVAFSLKAQPVWFRLIKWSVILFVTARYRRRWWFAYGVCAALAAALTLHGFYRWKTHGWTRAWGGWDDVPRSGR